jgi:hypothetical protein
MLNTTVSPMTADFMFLVLMCFSFSFAKGLTKCKLGGI